MSNTKQKTIIIVGGGIAGLTTATLLAEQNFKVTILEASEQAGGLAKSIRTPEGYPTEHSIRIYHDFYRCYFDILRRIKTDNGTVLDNLTSVAQYYHTNGPGELFLPKSAKFSSSIWRMPNLFKFIHFLMKYRNINFNDILRILKASSIYRRSEKTIKTQLDNVSVKEFFGLNENDEAFKKTIIALLIIAAGAREDSAAEFAIELLNLLNPSENLYMLNGPTSERLFDPWEKYLKKLNVDIIYNARIVDFNITDNTVDKLFLETGEIVQGDEYVFATSVLQTKELFHGKLSSYYNLEQQNIFQCDWSDGAQFYLSDLPKLSKKHKMFKPGVLQGFLDSPWCLVGIIQGENFWNNVQLPQGCKYIFSVAYTEVNTNGMIYGKPFLECTKEEIKNELLAQTEFQDLSVILDWRLSFGIKFMEDKIYQNQLATLPPHCAHHQQNTDWILSFTPIFTPNPGYYSLAPSAKTKLANLFLAGQYCQTTMTIPTMEKACESGFLAAMAIAEKYQLKNAIKRPFNDFNDREHSILRHIDMWVHSLFKK